ncbi:nuclear factor interleukin-3-regulated protein-like [Festucalex cinctus]
MTGHTEGRTTGDRSHGRPPYSEHSACSRHLTRGRPKVSVALNHKENEQLDESISYSHHVNNARSKRQFIPSERKGEGYWDKRKKNNEAAKRSRERRRANDMALETRVLSLLEENARLRAELFAIKFRFGLVKDFSDVSILPLAQSTPSLTRGSDEAFDRHQMHSSGHQSQHSSLNETIDPLLPSEEVGVSTLCQVPSSRELVQANSLPHKLRFKVPTGRETPPLSVPTGRFVATVEPNISRRSHPHEPCWGLDEGQLVWSSEDYENPFSRDPVENISFRSQISCLSQEVARLKQLFSQQMLSKCLTTKNV